MAPPCSRASRQLRAEVRAAVAVRPACHTRLGSKMSHRNLSASSRKCLKIWRRNRSRKKNKGFISHFHTLVSRQWKKCTRWGAQHLVSSTSCSSCLCSFWPSSWCHNKLDTMFAKMCYGDSVPVEGDGVPLKQPKLSCCLHSVNLTGVESSSWMTPGDGKIDFHMTGMISKGQKSGMLAFTSISVQQTDENCQGILTVHHMEPCSQNGHKAAAEWTTHFFFFSQEFSYK